MTPPTNLAIGVAAPQFTLPSVSGRTLSLSALRGRKVVLFFYPRDNTPGCTQEACDFRDSWERLRAAGVEVLGVSKDSLASHEKFQRAHGLPFELLSDSDNQVAIAYGAFGEKKMYGKLVTGTIRSTYVIDELGAIAAVFSPVKVKGHVQQVLAALGLTDGVKATGRAVAGAPASSPPRS
jgi:peroxiredoxin Q/BCP